MKKIILTITALLTLIIVRGQSTEYRISLNSGLYSYAGSSASETSYIFIDQMKPAYTVQAYGSKNGLCYGISGNIQRVTKQNFIVGLDVGYEILRSKVSIVGLGGNTGTSEYVYSATGRTFLNSNFMNMNPFFGYRIMAKPIILDITGGIDFAHCFKSIEEVNATDSHRTKYKTLYYNETITNDVRPRIQISTGYKKIGCYVGYSYGLTNYMSEYIGINGELYARLWRFGLTYQIN